MVEKMRQVYLTKQISDHENILLAISLGGMISAQWLKDYPQDFDKAVLLNTSYGGISKVFDRLKPSALTHLLSVPFLKGRAKEAHIIRLISNNKENFESTLNLWESIQKDRPVSLANTIRQLAAGGLFRIGDFSPQLPVLILASTKDRMVSVSCSRDIAKKWDLPIFEHPSAGHDITSDASDWVVEKIQNFIV
jgi:alpha-beta hydrolase superfamily lysophospholipase